MDEISDVATNKIGGIPVWGWAAGLSGIVLIFAWWRNRGGNAPTGPAIFDGTTTASGLANVGVPSSDGSAGQGNLSAEPPSLDDWMKSAVAAGGSNTDVLGALNNFLAGQPLSGAQKNTVDSILGKVGLPPNYASLGASQPSGGSSDIYDMLSSQLSDALSSFADQQSAYQDSINSQMQALSNSTNTLNIPKSAASTKPTRSEAIANAQKIAQGLGRSVQTAYGWVTPTGLVTSTDTTSEKKQDAKAMAKSLGHPVNTSFGWIIPNGVVYKTEVEARKAMGLK